MSEIKIQKGLNYATLVSLISIPVTGPIGLVVGGLCFAGKFARLGNYDRYHKYLEEKKSIKDKKKKIRFQEEMISLLERENERRAYTSSMIKGSEMLNNYLSKLPGEEYSKIKQIEILEKEKTILGFPTGNKSLEVRTIK